jgi:hypothetical protein
MGKEDDQNRSDYYRNLIRTCKNPKFTVITAIDGIIECPEQKKELLKILEERIRSSNYDHIDLMQEAISDLETISRIKRRAETSDQKKLFHEKRLVSCSEVSVFIIEKVYH